MPIRDFRVGADIPKEYVEDRPMWLVWKAFHDGYNASIYFGALPESHDGKRGMIGTPRPLIGDDRELSLDALAAKYPPLKGTDK